MIPVYAPKFRRASLSAVMAVAIFAVPTTGVFAQTRASTTITLNPSKDNTLIENGSGSLSNGAGQNIYVGRINRSSGSIRRAVLAFDISSVPSGATVESVSLSLNMSRSRSGGQTISAHKLTADWGEGSSASFGGSGASPASNDATWVHRFFSSTSWSSAPMVTDVQAWVDASATNFGWLLKGNESSQQTVKKFDSGGNSISSPPRVEHHLFGAGLGLYSVTYINAHTDSYANADAPTVYRLQRPYRRRCLTRDHGV